MVLEGGAKRQQQAAIIQVPDYCCCQSSGPLIPNIIIICNRIFCRISFNIKAIYTFVESVCCFCKDNSFSYFHFVFGLYLYWYSLCIGVSERMMKTKAEPIKYKIWFSLYFHYQSELICIVNVLYLYLYWCICAYDGRG